MMNWPRVEVTWLDTVHEDDTWIKPEDFPLPAVCYTRGWLIKEGEDFIVIAGTIDENGEKSSVGDVNTIPRGCVVEIKKEDD